MGRNIDLIYFKGTFTGLYEWGTGFVSFEKCRKWIEFWSRKRWDKDLCFWKVFNSPDCDEATPMLVCLGGAIYLHAEGFSAGLFGCGGTSGGKHFGGNISELVSLCVECAEFCGATFSFECTEELELNIKLQSPLETYEDYKGVSAERLKAACEKLA